MGDLVLEAFGTVMAVLFTHFGVREWLLEQVGSCPTWNWWRKATAYVISVGVMSLVGYVLGSFIAPAVEESGSGMVAEAVLEKRREAAQERNSVYVGLLLGLSALFAVGTEEYATRTHNRKGQ